MAHEWVDYDYTSPEEIVERLGEATIAVTNKVKLREPELSSLTKLKLVALTATGFDNVDLVACRKRGILVANIPGLCAAESVPEHVMMLILALRRNLPAYQKAIKAERWQAARHNRPLMISPSKICMAPRLDSMATGTWPKERRVLARAFGMEILIAERKGVRSARPGRILFEDVLTTLRCREACMHPIKCEETRNLIGAAPELALMKRTSTLLINSARGALVA